MINEVCLGVRLHVPFWCSFRDPTSSNVHRTFPVPPPTTLYGLVASAMGLCQDDYSRRDAIRFAIAIEDAGEIVETYSKWMKAAEGPKGEDEKIVRENLRQRGLLTPDESVWISTPLIRQKMIRPTFVVGMLCMQDVADGIAYALSHPFFPLCLGESDDPIDVELLGVEEPISVRGKATGTVTGVHPGGILASLPTRFHVTGRSKWALERWLVTIPRPGLPIEEPDADLWSCHGHTWSFEPALEIAV